MSSASASPAPSPSVRPVAGIDDSQGSRHVEQRQHGSSQVAPEVPIFREGDGTGEDTPAALLDEAIDAGHE